MSVCVYVYVYIYIYIYIYIYKELGARRDQTSCYLRPPFLGTPLVLSRVRNHYHTEMHIVARIARVEIHLENVTYSLLLYQLLLYAILYVYIYIYRYVYIYIYI